MKQTESPLSATRDSNDPTPPEHFTTASKSAWLIGYWKERALKAEATPSHEREGYPGIAHDFETMRTALRRLMKESAAVMALAEPQIRDVCGHTNFVCLQNAVNEAGKALASPANVGEQEGCGLQGEKGFVPAADQGQPASSAPSSTAPIHPAVQKIIDAGPWGDLPFDDAFKQWAERIATWSFQLGERQGAPSATGAVEKSETTMNLIESLTNWLATRSRFPHHETGPGLKEGWLMREYAASLRQIFGMPQHPTTDGATESGAATR